MSKQFASGPGFFYLQSSTWEILETNSNTLAAPGYPLARPHGA